MDIEFDEEWKALDDKYEISSYGRVRNIKTKRIRIPTTIKGGYLRVTLSYGKIQKSKLIHRLVAECFVDHPDNLEYVDHIDRNVINNIPSNLRWCTNSTNSRNRKGNINNTSGIRGISHYKTTNQWVAKIGTGTNTIRKCFNNDDGRELAIQWRRQKEIELGY